jgi:hypothetical protein
MFELSFHNTQTGKLKVFPEQKQNNYRETILFRIDRCLIYQRIIVGYTVIIYLYYSSGTKVDNSHKLLVTSSGDPKKDKLLQKAPVVP